MLSLSFPKIFAWTVNIFFIIFSLTVKSCSPTTEYQSICIFLYFFSFYFLFFIFFEVGPKRGRQKESCSKLSQVI